MPKTASETGQKTATETPTATELPSATARVPSLLGELAAEFFGTFVLILFGVGVVAQVVAGGIGDHDSIAWAWGFGVMLGAFVAGKISGAHLNPALTIALAAYQGFPWKKVAPYALAQTLGAFVAALVVRWNYTDLIAMVDPGHTVKTQGIFSTLPGNGDLPIGTGGALRDQIIGTAILVFVLFALSDVRNAPPMANLAPFIVGLLVVAIGMAWGSLAGYAINPARDFGPRLASFITGYGQAMRDQNGDFFFWVPIVGPIIGALVGGALYKFGLQRFMPPAPAVAQAKEL
ncbi:aquaporin family protein [Kineosporia sp. J2-2]|uniref:Aquaporin family protein n=1 Tax=Kineosporia corallincola TaxID=2835133 RepID=A0ABS5TR64_9ACTN|nr:MIP/aquaporin family protein [Kineosporia corallincola]MBT0772734.1 aquaporin family protein [Kineosporia corallincola]